MNRLENKKALVIGGNTGIGREVCRLFAQEGADVAVGDHGREEAGESSDCRPGSTWDEERSGLPSMCAPKSRSRRRLSKLSPALATSTSWSTTPALADITGPLQDETVDEWAAVMNVNLRGVFFGMKHALPHMVDRGYGRIINTASQLAHKPSPLNASYCASKAGVVALTAVSRARGRPHGRDGQRRLSRADRHPHVASRRAMKTGKRWKIDSLPMQAAGPTDRDRLGVRLPRLRRSQLLHRPEHLAQWRRRHVVIRLAATTLVSNAAYDVTHPDRNLVESGLVISSLAPSRDSARSQGVCLSRV